jgi:outer membrane protein assembly factor BamA
LADSTALTALGTDLLAFFRDRAHLAASIDSLRRDSLAASARLYLGPEIRWVALQPADEASAAWLDAVRFREKRFTDKTLDYAALLKLKERLLEAAENEGYPFASVRLDSLRLEPDGGLRAALRVTPNRAVAFKEIRTIGDVRLPRPFLPSYLGLRPGSAYSRAKVLRLRQQLQTLLFVESTRDPTVTFTGNEATVNLFLKKKRASRFDFIVGLLPQPGEENDGKLLVTGSLSAAFLNALNLAERLSVEFERLRPETQKLDVQAGIPYVLGTPFGLEGHLNIFRRDSSWVDAQGDFGVQYLFEGGDFIKFFWENRSLILQKIDTAEVRRSRRLPPSLDMRQNGFGLETTLSRLDYRYNPRQGWAATVRTVGGFSRILVNSQVEGLDAAGDSTFRYASLYDTVRTRQTRLRVEARGEWYLPLWRQVTFKLGLRGGGIFSETPVYANEQYRLGGNRLLRGFDEESLFTTRFAVATAELRLLLGTNSFLAAFTDYGYLENLTDRTRAYLRPWGFGAGINFESRAGIFGISVAVGRRDAGQPVDFRAAKFHLGYVSLF